MPAGRPAKYDPLYAALITTHLADGGTLKSFAVRHGLVRERLHRWRGQYPELNEAIAAGEELRARSTSAPVVHMRPAAPVFSLAAWGQHRALTVEGISVSRLSEDDVDDMLARAA